MPEITEPAHINPRTVRLTLESTLLVAATLLGTYFIAANTIFAALGFTLAASVLGGPIAIGIAVGVSFVMGLYFGYKHYQQLKNQEIVSQYKEALKSDISSCRKKLDSLTRKRVTNAPAPAPAPDPDFEMRPLPNRLNRFSFADSDSESSSEDSSEDSSHRMMLGFTDRRP